MSVLSYIDTGILSPVYQNKLPQVRTPSIDVVARELYYAISSREPIFIYGDYDMDGFCCAMLWDEVLSSLYEIQPVHFKYTSRTHNIDQYILEQVKGSGCRVVLICDTGSSREDRHIESLLQLHGYVPIIIDHHVWYGNYEEDSKTLKVFNSYEEKDSLDGCEVSGAYASLFVASYLCEHYFNRPLSYNAMVYALASMYSDCVDLSTPVGRALYNVVSVTKMPCPLLMSSLNTWGYSLSRRYFSFILAPKVNACFRTENFSPLNRAMEVKDRYGTQNVAQTIAAVHAESTRLVDMFKSLFERERFGGIVLCHFEMTDEMRGLHIRNFSGLIANKIAQEEKAMVVVVIRDGKLYQGSFRDFFNRNMLSTFKLFCTAEGHDSAFGISFSDIEEVRRYLSRLSTMLGDSIQNSYHTLPSTVLDSRDDVQVLALCNEYLNVGRKYLLVHRCRNVIQTGATSYRRFYNVGLPYDVCSTSPLIEGSSIFVEPSISQTVELRCVD